MSSREMRYRAEKASGGPGADVIDTEAKPMREVIARCGTLGQARLIASALNGGPDGADRIRILEFGLSQIAAANETGIWGKIARATLRSHSDMEAAAERVARKLYGLGLGYDIDADPAARESMMAVARQLVEAASDLAVAKQSTLEETQAALREVR